MKQEWQLESPKGRCAVTNRLLAEGEEFYSVVFSDDSAESGFRRIDYSLEAWQGVPEGAFCHFRTHIPAKEKRRRLLVDNDVLVNFFLRLGDESQSHRVAFRYVLALILMRKRILRYESSENTGSEETWNMTLVSDRSTHRVVNPKLTEEQVEGVSGQLGAILNGDAGQWSESGAEESNLSS